MDTHDTTAVRGDLPSPEIHADEKSTLVVLLGYLREAVIGKSIGLTDEQARRPGVGSGTSIAWLLKHLARVEYDWVVWSYAGGGGSYLPQDVPVADDDTLASLVAEYRLAIGAADAVIEACPDLSVAGVRSGRGTTPPSLRWVLTHLIEETARHAGHADILRERLDGVTGR